MLTNLFWAINATLARGYVNEVAPVAMNLFRWLGAFIILTPFALRNTLKLRADIKKSLLPLIGLAILSITLYNSLLYLSAHFTTAINITLINTLIPVATLLFAWRILANKPQLMQLVGMAVSIVGVLLILTQGEIQRLVSLSFSQGDLFMVAAVAVWALFTVLLRKLSLPFTPIVMLYLLILFGLPFLMLAYVIEALFFQFYWPSIEHIGLLAYLWIFPSLLAYLFWTNGVQKIGAEGASLSINLMPFFGALLAILFLGESIYWFHIIGGLCSLLGMLLALVPVHKLLEYLGFQGVN